MDPSKEEEEKTSPPEEVEVEEEVGEDEPAVSQAAVSHPPPVQEQEGQQEGTEPQLSLLARDWEIGGMTPEAEVALQRICSQEEQHQAWMGEEWLADWNKKNPDQPIQLITSEKEAQQGSPPVVDEGSSVDPPIVLSLETPSESQERGTEASSLTMTRGAPASQQQSERKKKEVPLGKEVAKPPPIEESHLQERTEDQKAQVEKASRVPIPDPGDEDDDLDYEEEMETDDREATAYRDVKELDLSDEDMDVTGEDIGTDEEDALLGDAGETSEVTSADHAIMQLQLEAVDVEQPQESLPLTGTTVMRHIIKRELDPPLSGQGKYSGKPNKVQDDIIAGKGTVVSSQWEVIQPITHEQTYGQGQEEMLSLLQGVSSKKFYDQVAEGVRNTPEVGPRVNMNMEETEHVVKVHVLAQEQHSSKDRHR